MMSQPKVMMGKKLKAVTSTVLRTEEIKAKILTHKMPGQEYTTKDGTDPIY